MDVLVYVLIKGQAIHDEKYAVTENKMGRG